MKDSVEGQQDVQRALKQAGVGTPAKQPQLSTSHKVGLATYVVLFVAFAIVLQAARLGVLGFLEPYVPLIQRLARGGMILVAVLGVTRLVQIKVVGGLESAVARYNLERVLRLLTALIVTLVAISILFVNWYAAAFSLGLGSLILGFALQTPITSFIGWVYILVREPYHVGDRIQIGEAKGDVIDVSYLDTTLWEFGGRYVSTDHPSGRIIKFPNSNVLTTAVYNYSWSLFPYIWNEIVLQVAYQSDLKYVSDTVIRVASEEVGEAMMERVRVYRDLVAQTPVDQLEVHERPVVIFRAGSNTWIEAVVRYLVHPKGAGAVKSRLTVKMIEALNAEPEKVMFPKGDTR